MKVISLYLTEGSTIFAFCTLLSAWTVP